MVVAGSAPYARRRSPAPEPGQELRLGRRAEVSETGRLCGRLDRGDVDVGCQVLAADVAVRVVVDGMPEVRAERSIAATDRIVELGRGVSVVDGEEKAALQAAGRVGDPAVDLEADLAVLALGEDDALGCESVRERGR